MTWNRVEYLVETDQFIEEYTNIFLTAKAEDKFQASGKVSALELDPRGQAGNRG
jgi:hypothetical protein